MQNHIMHYNIMQYNKIVDSNIWSSQEGWTTDHIAFLWASVSSASLYAAHPLTLIDYSPTGVQMSMRFQCLAARPLEVLSQWSKGLNEIFKHSIESLMQYKYILTIVIFIIFRLLWHFILFGKYKLRSTVFSYL